MNFNHFRFNLMRFSCTNFNGKAALGNTVSVALLLASTVLTGCGEQRKCKPIFRLDDVQRVSDLLQDNENLPTFFEQKGTGLFGYKEANGATVIKPQYSRALGFNEFGVATVFTQGKINTPSRGWSRIDRRGAKLHAPYFYDNGPDYFVAGLSRFVENGKIGFVNRAGQIVIPPAFGMALPFEYSEEVTFACKGCEVKEVKSPGGFLEQEIEGGNWGMIDAAGNTVMPFEYSHFHISDSNQMFLTKESGEMVPACISSE